MIFANEFFELSAEDGKVFCTTNTAGFPLKDFDGILRNLPRIKLTNFSLLKTALQNADQKKVEIGEWLQPFEIEVSRDQMTASLFLYETIEYIRSNSETIREAIYNRLREMGIVFGVLPLKIEALAPGKAFLIAQGQPPIKGEDAQITYLEVPERRPVIREDGTADYYELNFIFEISEGSWLGEKVPAEQGTAGTNIFGETLEAPPGKDISFRYDKKSAYEIEEEGKVILRSKISGVLEQRHGMISVNHHLPINGDVGIETGNINFEGSISISGTVMPGFSVIAQGDISINGAEGVSNAKLIKSVEGDIYIRGGIFGLGETTVEAGGNIFVKHVNEANLIAKGDINIGFYTLGSHLVGNSILVDERNGKIIGGKAIAKNQIVTAISGNRLERRTDLIIDSLDKSEVYAVIQQKAAELKKMQEDTLKLEEQILKVSELIDRLNEQQLAALEQVKQNAEMSKEQCAVLDYEIQSMMQQLRNTGKEEILVTKEAYPGTYIQIGKKSALLTKMKQGTFLLEYGELNV